MERILGCRCKSIGCDHWEVVLDDNHDEVHAEGAQGATLRCKSCGTEVTVDVNPHDDLIIVERSEDN